MPTAYLKVTDESGAPLNGVILTSGQYNTSPCPWGQLGCTSGQGNPIEGTTSASGVMAFSIPYTCEGEWSGILQADGYDDYPFDAKTGFITGDVNNPIGSDAQWTVQMVASSPSGGGAGNRGGNSQAGDTTNQTTAGVQSAAANSEKAASNAAGWITLQGGWLVIIIFALIGLAAYFVVKKADS